MIALLLFLAQAPPPLPPPADNSAAIFAGIVAVLGAVGTIVGHVTGKKAGRAESVNIANQPLIVKMAEEFVTRREFERLEQRIALDITDIKGLFNQTMQAIGIQNETLTKKIENHAKRTADAMEKDKQGHQLARRNIHQNLNRQGELLAGVVAKMSFKEDIQALAEAIRDDAKRIQEEGA